MSNDRPVSGGPAFHLSPSDRLYVGLLPLDPATKREVTGVDANWWLGLALTHILFTLELNSILRSPAP